ncbi:hypothetical protein AAY473_029850 [Plecturocebus cupreus]
MREGHHFYQGIRNKNGGGRVVGSLLNSRTEAARRRGRADATWAAPPFWAAPPPELRRLRQLLQALLGLTEHARPVVL